ncbi:Glutathione synthase/RimK-type ligase, ATP-grasp superfamily [Microbulbifer donghaiensis]|uniref:Glutathione synthase/RimK-type ligase, ATP-grasp superfamily n=1 Tax=Microbulbifer donghaiensis TaxID=494016 RepID=A0A1M5B2D9_9GAMM|nr:RimK family protein [Microbulbifer donghaiensis]SHF36629.1 Glutathione synthase/RimK-type ligase, ATP-grasp superfamily [Microbulbifer donghaiensis]
MSQVLIVIDQLDDWAPYYPSERVITFADYLQLPARQQRVRVINLCADYDYRSEGYYCSLLAEARSHHVLPSVRTLNDLSVPQLYKLQLAPLVPALSKLKKPDEPDAHLVVKSYFGQCAEPALQPLARLLFDRFACPVLEIHLACDKAWEIADLRICSHRELSEEEETRFADALDSFSNQVWRPRTKSANTRYDLAILVNPEEALPPSDQSALKKFASAGRELGFSVEIITPADYMRLPEFDALFIRETTAIDHHTYRFAKKAEAEGLVVLDDPTSILRCTNKIYLADLFATHKVPAPKTCILRRGDEQSLQKALAELGLPMVVKIPDGSFSRGVVKVQTEEDLRHKLDELFAESSLLLAQEFLYTEFDWRIGVLNNKPLYACRYYMAKNHWQIYNHGNKKSVSGGFTTLPTFEVPKAVLQAALKATKPIGNGFYGVDVKESAGKGYVIEVNDNPSIDSGVEDKYLGRELYRLILEEFARRLDARRAGHEN